MQIQPSIDDLEFGLNQLPHVDPAIGFRSIAVSSTQQLHISGSTVVWTIGNVSHLVITLENELIITALFASFDQHDTSRPPKTLVVLTQSSLRFYFKDGKHYIASLPFLACNIWALHTGIVIERTLDQGENTSQMPVLFTLMHPLQEAKPIFQQQITSSVDQSMDSPDAKTVNPSFGVVHKLILNGTNSGLIIMHHKAGQMYVFEFEMMEEVQVEEMDMMDISESFMEDQTFDHISPKVTHNNSVLESATLDRLSPMSIQRDRNFKSDVGVKLLWSICNMYN